MPNLKSMEPENENLANTEVITECISSIKEEVVELEDCVEAEQYDPSSEDEDHLIKECAVDQCISSSEQSESVGKKDVMKVPTKRKRVQKRHSSKSATSAKLIRTENVNQMFDEEESKITNSIKLSLSSKQSCPNKSKECQETVIQKSHTTIQVTQDRKTFLCERCDMSFDSIEKALTHRFKNHSCVEFAKEVKK